MKTTRRTFLGGIAAVCDTELEDEHAEEGEPIELNGDKEDEDNPSLGMNGGSRVKASPSATNLCKLCKLCKR